MTGVATAGIAAPATPLPRWLPWVFVPLLALPFHPFWLDFEQVRRGLLLVLVGAALVVWPVAAGLRTVERLLLAATAWLALALVANHATVIPWDAGYRLLWFVGLVGLLRLATAAPRAQWLPAIAATTAFAACFGLLQRLGLAEIDGYGTVGHPVSVFGNLNVAAEAVAVGCAASAVLACERRQALAALLLGGAYLAVNGSRSGLVALPLAIAWLAATAPAAPRRRLAIAGVAAVGLGLGFLLDRAAPGPVAVPPSPATAPFAAARGVASLEVRLEIAQGCLAMAAEAPWAGHGPGQFPVQYPRYRSAAEIEASSYGHAFATEPGTAHDDWLEILVEGGAPALLLWICAGLALVRTRWRERHVLAPLLAFAALGFVRSPLGNAPCLAFVALAAGATATAPGVPARRALWLRALGLGLAAAGILPVAANTVFAPYQHDARHARPRDVDALQCAATVAPFDARFQQLLAQERLGDGRNLAGIEAARQHAEHALALRPHSVPLLELHAEILQHAGRLPEAVAEVRRALALDPGNPAAALRLAGLMFQQREHEYCARAVYASPDPRIRDEREHHFAEFERLARERGDEAGARRYAAERQFVKVLALLGDRDPKRLVLADELAKALLPAFAQAGISRSDLRHLAAFALHALDRGQPEAARLAGAEAIALNVEFAPWQRALFGEHLQRLAEVPSWELPLGLR